jgi:hypothetical protein
MLISLRADGLLPVTLPISLQKHFYVSFRAQLLVNMEPAIRIERTTCGLRNPSDPLLNQQDPIHDEAEE